MKWISIVLLVFSTYLVADKSWSAEADKACSSLAKVKSQLTGTDTTLTTLTPGQVNWSPEAFEYDDDVTPESD